MKITSDLALPIVRRLMTIVTYNINIMDEYGVIVASGDMTRINQRHEGAVQVLTTGKEVIISDKESKHFSYTKPGVNLPIEFQDKIVGVVGITGNPDELYQFARVVKMSVEVLLQQIYMNNQLQHQIKAMEGWILDLVNPYEFDAKKLETMAGLIHIEYQIERSVFLVKINGLSQTRFEFQNQILNSLKILIDSQSLYVFLEEEFLFLSIPFSGKNQSDEIRLANKIRQVLEKMNISPSIGIGNRNRGIEGYRKSFFEAKQSIELLQKGGNPNRIAHIEDWGIMQILDSIPMEIRAGFIEKYLYAKNKLTGEWEETLRVFLESDLHVKKAAAKLHIHHNTLVYRLERIVDQLQLDPRKFNDAVLLNLLLIFDQLNGS